MLNKDSSLLDVKVNICIHSWHMILDSCIEYVSYNSWALCFMERISGLDFTKLFQEIEAANLNDLLPT